VSISICTYTSPRSISGAGPPGRPRFRCWYSYVSSNSLTSSSKRASKGDSAYGMLVVALISKEKNPQ
jgi:hypothetical protein